MEVSGQIHDPAALPQVKSLRYSLDRGWVGPRAGLDAIEKRKILVPVGNRTPTGRPSSLQYSRYAYWAIPQYSNIFK
jgi:hypothetical protein